MHSSQGQSHISSPSKLPMSWHEDTCVKVCELNYCDRDSVGQSEYCLTLTLIYNILNFSANCSTVKHDMSHRPKNIPVADVSKFQKRDCISSWKSNFRISLNLKFWKIGYRDNLLANGPSRCVASYWGSNLAATIIFNLDHAVILHLPFYFEFTLLRSLLKEIPFDFCLQHNSSIYPHFLFCFRHWWKLRCHLQWPRNMYGWCQYVYM